MIRAQNLSKYYGGKRALGPVSFEIEQGETVGFLGLNGAGKTTALRIFACALLPSSGTVTIGNLNAIENPHEARKRIGFLPETPPLYVDMTVDDYLQFAGKLRGMTRTAIKKRIPEVCEATHLTDARDEVIGTLSHGYRQRVGVGQAIIHKPELLILDEPTRGLDPVQIVEMRNLVRNLREKHTVLISSHILTEISQTCDRILVLGDGEILASGTEESLSSDFLEVTRIHAAVKTDKTASEVSDVLAKVDGASSTHIIDSPSNEVWIEVECSRDIRPDASRALIENGYDLLRMDRAHRELESIFLKLVQGGSRDASN